MQLRKYINVKKKKLEDEFGKKNSKEKKDRPRIYGPIFYLC